MGIELTVRREEGGTPVLADWGANCEYGVMRDVLLGPPETFRTIDNAQFSSVVRDSERHGKSLDTQLAQRQHRELVAAYAANTPPCCASIWRKASRSTIW